MNLDLDLSVVSRFFRGILTELRQKRLWPVAVLLLVALVAVPFLLSKSSSPAPAPVAQSPASPPKGGASIPALNVQTTPSQSRLTGASRNPFGTSGTTTTSGGTVTTSTATTASTSVSTASNGTSTSSTGGASSSPTTASNTTSPGTSSTSTSPSSNPPSITGNAKPKPAPTGLKPDQAYDVSLAITNGSGGVNTIDPLERASLIPSDHQPLLVELGVEQGANRVLFAVQPGAIPSGPGTCTPGPIDCEILSLGQDQTEELSQQTGTVGAGEVALFAVTGISATSYGSTAAADRVRRSESSAGRAALASSSKLALSLFQYEPGLGSVVDMRNLKVGG